MSIWDSGPAIVMYNILPSALAALVYLLIARLFILIFRIKKISYIYTIYLLVMYKSILVLITGARYSYITVPRKAFGFGTQLYDPLNLIPFGSFWRGTSEVNFTLIESPWLGNIVTIVLIFILGMLLYRWLGTAWFFINVIKKERRPSQEILNILSRLSAHFKVKEPNIVMSNEELGPLTIGIFKPTIVLPESLPKQTNNEELEIIIGHELAHIKRKDNLWQWFTLFAKDLLFFSPFSRIAYKNSQISKEIAADSLLLELMPDKKNLLLQTINKVACADFGTKKDHDLLIAKAHFTEDNSFKKRLKMLANIDITKAKSTFMTKLLGFTCLFLFLWLKAWIAIKVGPKALMLLS